MGVPRSIQSDLSKGDFDSLEDEWLQKAAEDPTDLDTFVSTARALVGTDQEDRARFLLGMLDEELAGRELWQVRLKLLQRAGHLYLEEGELHPAILETLHRLYGDRPNYEVLVDATGLERATRDIPKTWEKVEKFQGLIVFDEGSVVHMANRGVGRVAEVNRELESFKVDFEDLKGLTVGFRAAAKLLEPLPEGHILRRKLEEPEALEKLAAEDPPELLRQLLVSHGEPMKAGEVRDALSGVVTKKSWTSFWNAARKHPQVVAKGKGARQAYTWAESDSHALEAVWRHFRRAEPRRQIELMRREGERSPELQERMARALEEIAEAVHGDDPGLAFELWFAIDRSGGGAPEDVPWGPEALLAEVSPAVLFGAIEDRLLRERAYSMYRERHDDWPEIYQEMLSREEDPRALTLLAEGLRHEEPKRWWRFVDDLLAQPHRAPAAFVWLAERAAEDEELRQRNPMRLLQQILQALGREEFKSYRAARLAPMADSGGTLPRLLPHLNEDQAPQAEQAIRKTAGLESYQRDQLIEALRLRFQGLDQGKEEPLYATPESIEEKRKEFQQLITKELPANRKAIEEARALGDLRENFEYKAARQRHEYLSDRAAKMEGDLARAQPIGTDIDTSRVGIGTRVHLTVSLATGEGEKTVTILGPWESDPEKDVISYLSDLAQQLTGKKVGESVTVGGVTYTVEGVEAWK